MCKIIRTCGTHLGIAFKLSLYVKVMIVRVHSHFQLKPLCFAYGFLILMKMQMVSEPKRSWSVRMPRHFPSTERIENDIACLLSFLLQEMPVNWGGTESALWLIKNSCYRVFRTLLCSKASPRCAKSKVFLICFAYKTCCLMIFIHQGPRS